MRGFLGSEESKFLKDYLIMDNILKSIRNALQEENWYAALFVTLTLPDICVALESNKSCGEKYSQWFESHLTEYQGFLSGNDCYALRCSLLHQGKDDISDQRLRDALEHYVFLTKGPHCNLWKDSEINGVKTSFLQLNVGKFCEDMCLAVEKWLIKDSNNSDIQKRLKDTLEIHEPGYVHLGVIKFG